MAGIYIHVPYCKTRCIYCDFYKETNESNMDSFVNSLCTEFVLRKDETTETIQTIYFGGGTPSRLGMSHLEDIFSCIYSNYNIDNDAEITIECNPDDLTPEYIAMLKKLPFNRLSIGIQSFCDKELKFLSRRHSSDDAISSVKRCKKAGFNNISIDLIYGLPDQTLDIWADNLQKAIDLDIQHISAYHLIYEEKTKLYTLYEMGRLNPVTDEVSIKMLSMLIDTLGNASFEQYEVCSFARNKLYSRHNTSYWQDKKYLGFGPSAHSYNGYSRSWNIASLAQYMLSINKGILPQEIENLSEFEKYNEFVLTKLRMMEGLNLTQLRDRFGEDIYNYFYQAAQKYIDNNLLVLDKDMLRLTQQGIFVADEIMSEMMWID